MANCPYEESPLCRPAAPMGMIEEHGPHLPVGADTLGVTLALPMRLRAFTAGFPGRACVLR